MGDTRTALKDNTKLTFLNKENGRRTYTIQREISRGASCIVYDAFYENHSGVKKAVRIKECYPFRLSIRRANDGSLIPAADDREAFAEAIGQMTRAFDLGNELFSTKGLTNFMSNTVDLYQSNRTVYVVTVYQEGETLAERRFQSLKDCIAVVKSTAKVLTEIHDQGYLYLDLKPENIFSLQGTNDIVQLFDFDSLIPLAALAEEATDRTYRISYTRGYSALELQTGNRKRIGKYSDVYGIGAVLFSLIFGRIPGAPDCGMDAEYDFSVSEFASETFQDPLCSELTDFFHHTLANYYLDRYSDMRQVAEKLEKLEMLADTETPYIHSTHISCPRLFVGRKSETAQLERWFADEGSRCLVISGMGGIGKSTLARAYLARHARNFDTVLMLNAQESVLRAVTDDRQFGIHGVERIGQEREEEYFERKLRKARGLLAGKRAVLALDNFDGNYETIDGLLRVGWKVVLITRVTLCPDDFAQIRVGTLANRGEIRTLFEGYLRRQLEKTEIPAVDRMSELVAGHTLVLELIAKQIAFSYLSVEEALSLMEEKGFSGIAREKVGVTRDAVFTVDTVEHIIRGVFQSVRMTQGKRTVLKMISFFGSIGVDVRIFSELSGLDSKEEVNALAAEGWIGIEDGEIRMHPVIAETVWGWEWQPSERQLAGKIMEHLLQKICEIKEADSFVVYEKNLKNGNRRAEKADGDVSMTLTENFLERYRKSQDPKTGKAYFRLLFALVCRMPRYREEYILEKSGELLSADENFLEDIETLALLHFVAETYEERRDFARASEILRRGEKLFARHRSHYLQGKYCELWMDYYDFKLNGMYQAETARDRQIFRRLMNVTDRAIRCMRQSAHRGSRLSLGEYLRCKANFLIRGYPEQKKRIARLLGRVKHILDEKHFGDGELTRNYCLTLAWYFTYVEPDYAKAVKSLRQAHDLEKALGTGELDLIDDIYVPCANILLEWGEPEWTARILSQGIRICAEKEEIVPYARKKKELEGYLRGIRPETRLPSGSP